ncbi:zinc finger protein 721-like isoform X1 [Bufo bufo]|nr:zinc finger protein 721-like isoform X1 [Bufo bufo]XP_040276280.1 zinc finger protein 721-like isoform X1 [Bufo bufo]
MDPSLGFEVGAEVELNDNLPVLEDLGTISLENKQDLPAWHHLHYVEESSSDESLDHQHVFPTSSKVKNMETSKHMLELKTQTERNHQWERKMFSTSDSLYMDPPPLVTEKDDRSVVWSDGYDRESQDQTCPMVPSVEEIEISHLEMVPSSNYTSSPTRPVELYSEMMLSQEGDEAEPLGRYSFYNTKTQCTGTVKPGVGSHKCSKCGRQFGRMYNLESHMCIKTALTRVGVDDTMSGHMSDISNSLGKCEQSEESMDRLEKMCAEAQKELHNLQELYGKEEEKPLLSCAESTQVDGSHPDKVLKYQRSFSCDRCGRWFRKRFNLESHVCCIDKNMSAPQNTIVMKPDSSIALNILGCSDPTYSTQDRRPRSKCESLDCANEGKVFTCQYCGKVYNRRASYVTHLRWHSKEKDLVSSVNKSLATGDLEPLLTTINRTSVGLKKKTGPTFTCQECGRIFYKRCFYSTHILWHSKRRNSGSALAAPSVNQVVEGQETRAAEAQVPAVSPKHQGRGGTKKVAPDNVFTCQECGRVFSKRMAYSNHARWHIKERELELSVRGMEHQLRMSSNGVGNKHKPISSLQFDHFQGYCNLVKPLNLGEQQNIYINDGMAVDNPPYQPVDSGQQRTPAEVPEFIFELEVGTESFHEGLINRDVEVSDIVGDAEETISRTQTSSSTNEPSERPVLSRVLPCELLRRLLKRQRWPHRCRDCGTCFSQAWRLKFHQYKGTMWRSRHKRHRCECGRSPTGLLHFLRHQLQHLSDTAFICAVCGKVLRGHQQLRAHSGVHPLVCQFHCKCGAQFTKLTRYLWHSLLNKTWKRRRPQQKRRPKP